MCILTAGTIKGRQVNTIHRRRMSIFVQKYPLDKQ